MNTQTALTTINKEFDFSSIDRADLQPTTRIKYKREIQNLLLAGVDPMDYNALQFYADSLKSSRKAFLKSGLRLLSLGYEQTLKAGATDKNILKIQASLLRLDAMRGAVVVPTHKGVKAHTWLNQKQVKELTTCENNLEGRRNWIILGLLLGAGLRRDELAQLTFDALKQIPQRGGKLRDVLQVTGKGAKDRVIPINKMLADKLRAWGETVKGGKVARSLGMNKKLGESMSSVAIFELVRKAGESIGLSELAPHDLRRTYAQLGFEAGVPITQISVLLGHSSVATTQKYLNLSLDLEVTASDFVPLAE